MYFQGFYEALLEYLCTNVHSCCSYYYRHFLLIFTTSFYLPIFILKFLNFLCIFSYICCINKFVLSYLSNPICQKTYGSLWRLVEGESVSFAIILFVIIEYIVSNMNLLLIFCTQIRVFL